MRQNFEGDRISPLRNDDEEKEESEQTCQERESEVYEKFYATEYEV